jgi:hypothetical protein
MFTTKKALHGAGLIPITNSLNFGEDHNAGPLAYGSAGIILL